MSRFQRSIVLVLLFAFSACSQNPVVVSETSAPTLAATFTPAASETLPVLNAALPTFSFSTPSATPLVRLTPTPTPTAAVMPVGFSPVLHGKKYDADTFFSLLGGVQGGQWLSADQAAAQMTGA
jgi:hypothetical protein